jgi:hypothetical protein
MMLQTWHNYRDSESFCGSLRSGKRISYCTFSNLIDCTYIICCKYLHVKLKNMTQIRTFNSRVISSRSSK